MLAPKVTRQHMQRDSFSRLKVKFSAQVLVRRFKIILNRRTRVTVWGGHLCNQHRPDFSITRYTVCRIVTAGTGDFRFGGLR